MRKKFDLIVFGGICCDVIMSGIEKFPNPGEEIWAKDMKMTVGGSFNVAAAAARLNLKTGVPAVFGTDILSEFIKRKAVEEEIDTSLFLNTEENYEQLSVVLNFGKERSFVSYAADDKNWELEQHMEEIVDQVPMEVAVFGMSRQENIRNMMERLRRKGTKVVLDCSWDEDTLQSEELRKQIGQCDYFLPNLAEARQITGVQDPDKAVRILAGYAPKVAIKMGGDGVIYAGNHQVLRYPAIHLGDVVDTTGAGDNFVAGFCYGLVHRTPVEQCIQFGQLCGGKSVVAVGGFTASLYENELCELVGKKAI